MCLTTFEKHARGLQAKSRHQRVIVPKHTKSKFDQQQARDAQAALKHRSVKRVPSVKVKPATPVSRHQRHLAATPIAKHATRHSVKHATTHRVSHHKHHRAA